MDKPFSQACENNKQPILNVIKTYFTTGTVLEIGSGTGQHARYFAEHLPEIFWQTSDRIDNHLGINAWCDDYTQDNLGRPLQLDVNQIHWPISETEGIFSANTAHIMDWSSVEVMFRRSGEIIQTEGYFCLYGPINIDGNYTSASNHAFDLHLKQIDSRMGIRELNDLKRAAHEGGYSLYRLHEMPANNFLMVWQKLNG